MHNDLLYSYLQYRYMNIALEFTFVCLCDKGRFRGSISSAAANVVELNALAWFTVSLKSDLDVTILNR